MKNPKILIPIVVLILGLFVGKTLFAKAPTKEVKPKVHGQTYVLPKDFLVNLKDGRFAKLNVGLVLKHGYLAEAVAAASSGGHGGSAAPEGYGELPQEAIVRDIITDQLTDADSSELVDQTKRKALKVTIAKSIKARTDVQLEDVLLTDVAVQ